MALSRVRHGVSDFAGYGARQGGVDAVDTIQNEGTAPLQTADSAVRHRKCYTPLAVR